jgi:acyl transferase domain-containing protein
MTLLPTYKAPHGGAQPAQPLDLASGPRRGQDPAGIAEWQVVWVLSGTSPAALQAQARRLHDSPTGGVNWAAADVALSLATTRKALAHRATVTGASRGELLHGLRALADGSANGERAGSGGLAVLFAGQGSQRVAMGRRLAERFPVFAREFETIGGLFDEPVRRVIHGQDAQALSRTEFTQPAVFALEVALFRLVQSWGVRVDYVTGHSFGEIAAAHVAGVLSLCDAVTLVTARGRLTQALPEGGVMVAIQAGEHEVLPHLTSGVAIAGVNSDTSLAISGSEDEVDAVLARFTDRWSMRLPVSRAFHSPLMEPMLAQFRTVLAELRFAEPRLPIVSTLTGSVAAEELLDPEYFVRQIRQPVRFADAFTTLRGLGVTTFLELGPDAVLTRMMTEATKGSGDVAAVPMLRADQPEDVTAVAALARLFRRGVDVDPSVAVTGARVTDLRKRN